MRRALIIGCGYTGRALAGRLTAAGVAVDGTSASGGAVQTPRGTLTLRPVDLLAPGPPRLPPTGGAVVYYMVSTLARRRDPGGAHLAPMERVLDRLARDPPRALIYLSSTSVYGDRGGAWVDEATPIAPGSPWGRMRAELEQLVLGQRFTPAAVVRIPEIYGPGRGPTARLRRPGGYVLRFPGRHSNRIHVDDLALALHQLGQAPEHRLLLAADDEPATAREVYRYAARALGLPGVEERAAEGQDADDNVLGLMRDSKRCSNARLRAWLREPLRFPTYREGITAIVAADGGAGG